MWVFNDVLNILSVGVEDVNYSLDFGWGCKGKDDDGYVETFGMLKEVNVEVWNVLGLNVGVDFGVFG
jgi:hypothetical protein